MRRRISQLWKDASGATLIFVAIAIFGLAAVAVIGVDVGRLLVTRVQLQNAADAGALAGAKLFVDNAQADPIAVESRARAVTRMNQAYSDKGPEDLVDEQIEAINVDLTDHSVEVITRSEVAQYFTRIPMVDLGSIGRVRARAVAAAGEICATSCIKPWSVPDRHDDLTLITGYPSWRGNGLWDGEEFTDRNGDNLWNPGEPFVDNNGNGRYDSEFYHPILTGYIASRDHGLQVNLKANNGGKPQPSQYYAIDLPDENGEFKTGADWYRWNIANCNPTVVQPGDMLWTKTGNMVGPTNHGMRELYELDPTAEWDDLCRCVTKSKYAVSPRVGIIPFHDPRIPLAPGKQTILVRKLGGFFIERLRGNGEVTGRFLRIMTPGELCPEGTSSGGFAFNLSLIK